MPGRGTPRHAIRIPPALWEAFGAMTERSGTDRNAVLRAMIAWYVGEGELPARPAISPPAHSGLPDIPETEV